MVVRPVTAKDVYAVVDCVVSNRSDERKVYMDFFSSWSLLRTRLKSPCNESLFDFPPAEIAHLPIW